MRCVDFKVPAIGTSIFFFLTCKLLHHIDERHLAAKNTNAKVEVLGVFLLPRHSWYLQVFWDLSVSLIFLTGNSNASCTIAYDPKL